MKQKVTELNCYFEERIAACDRRGQELLDDDRGDEAAFEKIKANVYDIFRTILSVAVKICKGDPDAVEQFFLGKIKQIPASWAVSLEKARQNDDTTKMYLELIKLDTVGEIQECFQKIWEGTK